LKDIKGNEILFFSDGISTLSYADFVKDKRPVHSVVSSSKADYSTMKLIAGKTNGKFVNLNALSSEQLKNELFNETLQYLGTEHGSSVREVYPSIATPVQGNFSIAGISSSDNAELTLLFGFGNKVEKKIKVKFDAKSSASRGNIYRLWAQKKIAELDLNYEKNRTDLTELGQQFGIVTRNTSLIVLETIEDYVQYGIEPPASEPDLRAEYQRRQDKSGGQLKFLATANAAIPQVQFHSLFRDPDFAAGMERALRNAAGMQTGGGSTMRREQSDEHRPRRRMAASGGKPRGRSGPSLTHQSSPRLLQERVRDVEYGDNMLNNAIKAAKVIKEWWNIDFTPQQPKYPIPDKAENVEYSIEDINSNILYLSKLTGKTAEDYQIYLKLRNDYANQPTFYFDMANWFYTHGDKETALRILTSIAELDLENASLYRLLGYKFKEYGEHSLQKFVCQKVIQWRPMEPQSYRDYALALADNGETQAALDSLYAMLKKPYSREITRRNSGIAEVAVAEINHLIAKNPKLNISKIDKDLIINIPVDIRVVMNWNMNNTDIDLHIIDPNNETCYYEHNKTNIGGRISKDITGGYGPEQFMLKKAVKGKYKIYTNYYSAREFAAHGPSTIMAEIYIKYADKSEQRKVVNLQLSNSKERVEVAEFEF